MSELQNTNQKRDVFNIERQFEEYIIMAGANKLNLSEKELMLMEHSFYSAIGFMIGTIIPNILELGEKEFSNKFSYLERQVYDYLTAE